MDASTACAQRLVMSVQDATSHSGAGIGETNCTQDPEIHGREEQAAWVASYSWPCFDNEHEKCNTEGCALSEGTGVKIKQPFTLSRCPRRLRVRRFQKLNANSLGMQFGCLSLKNESGFPVLFSPATGRAESCALGLRTSSGGRDSVRPRSPRGWRRLPAARPKSDAAARWTRMPLGAGGAPGPWGGACRAARATASPAEALRHRPVGGGGGPGTFHLRLPSTQLLGLFRLLCIPAFALTRIRGPVPSLFPFILPHPASASANFYVLRHRPDAGYDIELRYITPNAANAIISQVGDYRISSDALRAINTLLDELLYSLLVTTRSLDLTRIKQAVTQLLPNSLGKNAVVEAELEMKDHLDSGAPVDYAGLARTRDLHPHAFPLDQTYSVLRRKCAFRSALGDGRELELPTATPVDGGGVVTSLHVVYVTAILEHVADYVLTAVARVADLYDADFVRVKDVYAAMLDDREIGGMFKRTKLKLSLEKRLGSSPDQVRSSLELAQEQLSMDRVMDLVDFVGNGSGNGNGFGSKRTPPHSPTSANQLYPDKSPTNPSSVTPPRSKRSLSVSSNGSAASGQRSLPTVASHTNNAKLNPLLGRPSVSSQTSLASFGSNNTAGSGRGGILGFLARIRVKKARRSASLSSIYPGIDAPEQQQQQQQQQHLQQQSLQQQQEEEGERRVPNFDEVLQSGETMKVTLTPNRLRSIVQRPISPMPSLGAMKAPTAKITPAAPVGSGSSPGSQPRWAKPGSSSPEHPPLTVPSSGERDLPPIPQQGEPHRRQSVPIFVTPAPDPTDRPSYRHLGPSLNRPSAEGAIPAAASPSEMLDKKKHAPQPRRSGADETRTMTRSLTDPTLLTSRPSLRRPSSLAIPDDKELAEEEEVDEADKSRTSESIQRQRAQKVAALRALFENGQERSVSPQASSERLTARVEEKEAPELKENADDSGMARATPPAKAPEEEKEVGKEETGVGLREEEGETKPLAPDAMEAKPTHVQQRQAPEPADTKPDGAFSADELHSLIACLRIAASSVLVGNSDRVAVENAVDAAFKRFVGRSKKEEEEEKEDHTGKSACEAEQGEKVSEQETLVEPLDMGERQVVDWLLCC
ncbi:uncharacterized protein VTP21DRAFT_6861 [Calcarisporiella thermophila]|uniref:uncharacterized protein n=1 Tax=Calcarisporiella thermophila TaxID=911321 RepID=UPI0037439782